jgi:hypothetical protein
MHSRILTAVTVAGLALAGCSSDGDDAQPATTATEPAEVAVTEPEASDATQTDVEPTSSGSASIELATDAPGGADIVIDAVGIATDRPVQRGGQPATEQGQTFAVEADSILSRVSFHVVAPDGLAAGTPVELAVYEVANLATMVPSGPVDVGDGTGRVMVSLPDPIEPNTSTHLVFTLPDVAVAPGQYAVVLSFSEGAPPSEMYVQHPDGDTYADGVAISLEGEFWKSNTNDADSAVTITFAS